MVEHRAQHHPFDNCAVIVAHPDDETLWAGGTILMHPESNWTAVTVCRKSDADRAPRFARALDALDASGRMGDLDDGPEQSPLPLRDVEHAIMSLLPSDRFHLVITHSLWGEYTRHLRHEETARAVMALRRPLGETRVTCSPQAGGEGGLEGEKDSWRGHPSPKGDPQDDSCPAALVRLGSILLTTGRSGQADWGLYIMDCGRTGDEGFATKARRESQIRQLCRRDLIILFEPYENLRNTLFATESTRPGLVDGRRSSYSGRCHRHLRQFG